jgi:hypothetical protein
MARFERGPVSARGEVCSTWNIHASDLIRGVEAWPRDLVRVARYRGKRSTWNIGNSVTMGANLPSGVTIPLCRYWNSLGMFHVEHS